MATVRQGGCCICGSPFADAHHLRTAGDPRGLGIKPGDDKTIPLCRLHHDELHMYGDEKLFLDMHGIDAVKIMDDIKGGSK